MSNEANGGGMSRVEALEAVAEAAERVVRLGFVQSDGALAQSVAALRALDALPAAPAPARGEVVEVRKIVSMVTGRDADDVCLEYAICTDGTAWLLQWEDCKPIGWKQLPPIPTTRLAMVKGDGA